MMKKTKNFRNLILSVILLGGISLSVFLIANGAAPNPGHDFTSIGGGISQGGMLYGSAADTLAALAKSTTAGHFLSNSGSNNNPAWTAVTDALLSTSDVTTNDVSTSKHGFAPKAPNDTTKFLRGDATWAVPAGGSGYRNLVTLGGDVINNNATLNTIADCTGLSFPVTAGTRYHFYAQIWYTSAATTTGSRWTINGPAATNMAYKSTYTLAATTVTTNFATAYNIPAASNASSLTAGNIAIIEGTVLPSASGTVIVRFASEIASSAITCKAGSTLEWW